MLLDLKLKRQVSSEQLDALVQFLKEYPELAKGLTRGRRGKLNTFKLWNLCAKKLNVLKDGATKDGKMWSKYWCDLKYRVRRRALELRAAEQSNTLPENTTPLTALEEEILSIIGQGALDSIIIRTDPLADADMNNIENNVEKNSEAIYSETQTKIKAGKKRCNISTEIDDVDSQGVSSCDKKPKLTYEDDPGRDEATEFLCLEREKLEYIKKSSESLELIAPAITRLVDVMSHIRDVLINNRINM
ncbi:uncharacterized protein LOC123669229 [Melitaea cinxia]|uniref:uncharacterized protein LOC123669229 n=1 Tax=Melitaea cinxia TaxID=113334 RepID=UPI001E26EE15|nr:uncharacterized protein LOC123669229 [Melitaea cinxia]